MADWAVGRVRRRKEALLSGGTARSPSWLSGKEAACQYRRCRFDPWAGKIPWRRKWPTHSRILGQRFHGQRSLAGYSPQGRRESDTTEHALRRSSQAWRSSWPSGRSSREPVKVLE